MFTTAVLVGSIPRFHLNEVGRKVRYLFVLGLIVYSAPNAISLLRLSASGSESQSL